MKYTETEVRLIDAMAEMDIIDAHEHIKPESVRLSKSWDLFVLFSHYTRHDLFSSGMDRSAYGATTPEAAVRKDYESLYDMSIPLEQRWRRFKPYWERIKYGSYARAARLTAKLVYGVDDINDDTYQELSSRIQAENTPGIYRRILCDRCRIVVSLSMTGETNVERPLVPVMPIGRVYQLVNREQIEKLSSEFGMPIKNVDDCVAVARRQIEKWANEGVPAIKFGLRCNRPPDRKAAEDAFKKLMDGQELALDSENFEPLENFMRHHCLEIAADLDMVAAVHTGMWGDFRNLDPKHMLTLAPRHPRTNFDMFHLGMPMVRDAIVIGKNMPNVFLGLTWTYIISQAQTASAIDEIIDQVPVNKVIAFGGDYRFAVEKVVGHLHMARETLAQVFGRRIDRGLMSFDEAMYILKLWFWDNPRRLYSRLKL